MTVSKASLSKVQYTTPIADLPDAPIIDSVTNVGTSRSYNDGAATVNYTAVATGGTPVSFTATSSPGGYTASGSSPITVTGLQSDTSYTFTMNSTNATGTGASGPASSAITATTIPNAPTIGTATRVSDTVVSLTFTPPANGGSAITSYIITSSPSITITTEAGTSSPLTATGTYIAGTEYTFTIAAVNANGTSVASSASNGVTVKEVVSFTTNYLVVAGGGGVNSRCEGAGGAGGYRTSSGTSGQNSSAESALTLTTGTTYAVTVGAGGAGFVGKWNPGGNGNFDQVTAGQNGGDSVFSTITSLGGGRQGAAGGSGGSNGAGTANQGFAGGNSSAEGRGPGGGGAGGAGGDAAGHNWIYGGPHNGAGGAGLASNISGTSVTRAQGAHGTTGNGATAGTGGGSPSGTPDGAVNTGGGAGNGTNQGNPVGVTHGTPGGGSGVVILRYPSARTITVGAGLTGSTSTDGSDKVTILTAGTGNVIWD